MLPISDYINALFGNKPDQEQLESTVKALQEKFADAQNGIFNDPQYRRSPFDPNSTQGQAYTSRTEKMLKAAEERLAFFYPTQDEQENAPKV